MALDVLKNLISLPVLNLTILCLTAVIALVLVGTWLSNMGYIQLGSFTIRKEQQGQTTMHSMDEENNDLDDYLHMKLRQMTNAFRQRIINMFDAYENCTMTSRALSSAIRFPLYESVHNNHFTKELMPGQFEKYRQRILDALEDEYKDIASTSDKTTCGSNDLPPWKTASIIIEQLLDVWLRDTANLVQDCSSQKLGVYKKYLAMYEVNKDKFRITIANACIEKNNRYVEELNRLSEKLGYTIKNREEKLPNLD